MRHRSLKAWIRRFGRDPARSLMTPGAQEVRVELLEQRLAQGIMHQMAVPACRSHVGAEGVSLWIMARETDRALCFIHLEAKVIPVRVVTIRTVDDCRTRPKALLDAGLSLTKVEESSAGEV